MPRGRPFVTALIVSAISAACSSSSTPGAPVAASSTAPSTSSTTTTLQTNLVNVPSVSPPAIDGILDDGEWNGAITFVMSDGATILLMEADETLYVAVEGTKVGSVNVALATTEEIWILHSSAALGSARYTPGSNEWELSHGFDWCCRDRNDDSDRLMLLDEEGWQANIGFTGDPGIVEYQIDIPWNGTSVAISSVRDDTDRGFWPADLSDEARLQLVGPPPATRHFEAEQWPRLQSDGGP